MSYVWLLRNQKATFPTFGSGNSQSQSEGDGNSMCFPCKHCQLKKLLELEISSNFYTMLVVKALKFIYIHNQGSKRNIITFLRNLSFTLYLRISLNSPKTTNFITKKEKNKYTIVSPPGEVSSGDFPTRPYEKLCFERVRLKRWNQGKGPNGPVRSEFKTVESQVFN